MIKFKAFLIGLVSFIAMNLFIYSCAAMGLGRSWNPFEMFKFDYDGGIFLIADLSISIMIGLMVGLLYYCKKELL